MASSQRTIDDTHGDSVTGVLPTYGNSVGPWNAQPGCETCALNEVDVSQVFDGTWHDNTYVIGSLAMYVILQFEGTSIDVFNIVPIAMAEEHGFRTDIEFLLDDKPNGTWSLPATSQDATDYLYNQQVYSAAGLANTSHTLVMTVPADAPNNTVIMFDYAAYTFEGLNTTLSSGSSSAVMPSSTSSASPSSDPGAVIPIDTNDSHGLNLVSTIGLGVALGSLFLMSLIGWAIYIQAKERRRRAEIRASRAQATGKLPAMAISFDPTRLVVNPFIEAGEAHDTSTLALTAPLDSGDEAHNVLPTAGPEVNAVQAGSSK